MGTTERKDIFPIPEPARDAPHILEVLGLAALKVGEVVFEKLPQAIHGLRSTSDLVVSVNQEVAEYRPTRN